MPQIKSHLTTQNILLSVIGGLLLFMATQMQRSFDKSDDASEMVHEIKTAFITIPGQRSG